MPSPVRTGVISAAGVASGSAFGANAPFNLSLYGFGSATIKLERAFPNEAATLGDRLLAEDLSPLTSEDDAYLNTESSTDLGFRPTDSFTADIETIVDVVGETVFRLNCTSYSSGSIEYRLGGQ